MVQLFIDGGGFMWPILFIFIIGFVFVGERLYHLIKGLSANEAFAVDVVETFESEGVEDAQNHLGIQRAKQYCRCITIMITDKYSIEQIVQIGQQSQEQQLKKFSFATDYCNLNPKAPTDK